MKIAATFRSIVNRKWLIVGFFFLLTLFFLPLAKSALASSYPQTNSVDQNVQDLTRSLYGLLAGDSQHSGALRDSGQMVAFFFSAPPVSGVRFISSEARRFNPVKEAYAATTPADACTSPSVAGVGFTTLCPIQTVWSAFRNISYVAFVIVFVIIGFMVMFRAHISPQAVATIQDSLPRIVIALILVTFSYAIAGLMIDIMFVFLNIAINAFVLTGLIDTGSAQNLLFGHSVFGGLGGFWGDAIHKTYEAVKDTIIAVVDIPVLDQIAGLTAGAIASIVMAIAILFIMFRLFFMMLIAYITIILMTIFAPFLFLFQALPGNNGAKDWFKQMVANVAVFPAVAIMFLLAGIFTGSHDLAASPNVPSGGIISSGQVGQFPLFVNGLDPSSIGQIIGLGILLITPSVAQMIKERLGVKGGLPFAPAAAALGAAGGAVTKPLGAVTSPIAQSMQYRYGARMADTLGRVKGFGIFKNPYPGTKEEEQQRGVIGRGK